MIILRPSEFKNQYFEGKSDNWYVKMEIETESKRIYTFSYIGEGNRPSNFKYEIYESPKNTESGDDELYKKQEQFVIDYKCSGACETLSENILIEIKWEEKKRKK